MHRLLLAAVAAVSLAAWSPSHAGDADTLYQVSTIASLLDGAYDGALTCDELLSQGDFGLGTFDALDGEMVVLGGRCFQVRVDGVAYPVEGAMTTPFAEVTGFWPDASGSPAAPLDMDGLKAYVDGIAPDMGIPCAVKVSGTFRYMKTRSVPRQDKPYPRLVDAVKGQKTFEFRDVKGTLVGFRMPAFMDGVNAPGYHLHFLTEDRKAGGHVLALTTGEVTVETDDTPEFRMTLPRGVSPGRSAAGGAAGPELERVEGGR